MLSLRTIGGTRLCDGLTRRDLLHVGALGLGGLALPQLLRAQAARAADAGRKPAKSVIVLFLNGGPSQLDMWDLKPDAPEEVRGTFRPIDTTVPGMRISEHLPRTARQAKHFTILRAVHHATGNHPAAAYWMMVGSPIQRLAPQVVTLSREDRPHPGSVIAKLLPAKAGLPPFVMVPEAISPVGPERPGQHAGFLGAAYDPYRVNSDPNLPDYTAGALDASKDLPRERFERRRSLLQQVSAHARHLEQTAAGQTLDPYYVRAFDMLSSQQAQQAFDISAEPASVRDRYGRHVFGQSVLLARRLVEAGVRLVHVNWVRHDNGKGGQGYDSHRDHLEWSKTELLPPTDAALASLLEDLHERGLLAETLVLVIGEFGRTPKFNANGGRDHWPNCFSVVMAGGGVTGGEVFGTSDKYAAQPTANPVSPQDILATVYHRLGVEPDTLIHDQQQRPFALVEGEPIEGIF
ncbi:MAG: DUF1501 domain-containing protein [Planctomycetia bacterium]|nr:DUF1501 domain-containing protein [Planctomycetia bacterium]